ncbi:C45 family autoproteolytic acyltransferase/hydrolase [Ornithinibacillus sp. 4-3]|uniref:C45 family autoproteolytic acyltransferase/hydrolase n=1 Tax=Ornithinibacillus sp. 4-3 TaxID=3231488 RepID=A0AB39HNP9_9BACI
MKQIYSEIIQCRGSHYDLGWMQGNALKDGLVLKNRKKQWKVNRPRFSVDEQEAKEVIFTFAPQIWDELLGLQDALEWPIEEIIKFFSGYQMEYRKSGCSIYTTEDYMIRNYDYHPKTYEGRFVLFQPTDKGHAIIGPSQLITGRMDGMNEHGLAIGYNYIHQKKPGAGFVCNMIARIILETCENVEQACEVLKEIPHRHSFTYVVLDTKGITYAVEATPRKIIVREANICTNHFEELTDENRYHLDDSFRRMAAIQAEKQNLNTVSDAFHYMNNREGDVFAHQYKSWSGTIHTSAYLPKQKEVWFGLGGNARPVIFDFAKWLSGEKLFIKRMIGELDTEAFFLHMDKEEY